MDTKSINSKKKILVILGPTATGKTDLGLKIAEVFKGEIISADSRQVYKNLDIGTNKFPGKYSVIHKHDGFWVIDDIPIWGYDVVDPNTQYSVFDFLKYSLSKIDEILKKDKLPIVVGGTGLYIRALTEGLSNLEVSYNLERRKELENLTLEEVQKILIDISPSKFESLNNSEKNNKRRLVRHIEIETSKKEKPEGYGFIKVLSGDCDILKIGITASREFLKKRVNKKVVSWIEDGIIDEAKSSISRGISVERLRELGLEYRIVADYIDGVIKTKEDLIDTLQIKNNQYVKRQLTWFKKESHVVWFDITNPNHKKDIEKTVRVWYHKSNDQKG
ncbi:MAG: tRNA dimethylallyltransferase [Candidatus Daviesbacteria bacterium GW2011_GWA2_38_24]|uniref:tRNA dimethylallyltransferase n=1 Tax=Candidatus Daviesbacteria bacterium GW2011_GWA2_38_24 TaxID=1618422 RepID=A0A0G0JW96_9BACT|nr:MAG: tRNA dimethylallyltransferase [Candidatus Daviesbacteria bacterium GW2011_GWA2_38_24]KKQ80189.1 MAG: tRNA dimethylallyltransferase [Candidatus Daviesbacteria bacterium GW2011_GWA1_38_7]